MCVSKYQFNYSAKNKNENTDKGVLPLYLNTKYTTHYFTTCLSMRLTERFINLRTSYEIISNSYSHKGHTTRTYVRSMTNRIQKLL